MITLSLEIRSRVVGPCSVGITDRPYEETPDERKLANQFKDYFNTDVPYPECGAGEFVVVGRWFAPNYDPPWSYQVAKVWPIRRQKNLLCWNLTEAQLTESTRTDVLVASIDFAQRQEKFRPKFEIGQKIAIR